MSHSAMSMRRDGAADHAVGGKETAAKQHLPDVLDRAGVLADQQRLEVLDGAHHRQLAAAEAGLANTVDAFVRVDGHEQVVARAVEDREALDIGDLHGLAQGSAALAEGLVQHQRARHRGVQRLDAAGRHRDLHQHVARLAHQAAQARAFGADHDRHGPAQVGRPVRLLGFDGQAEGPDATRLELLERARQVGDATQMRRCSTAPAEAFETAGVTPTARCSGIRTASTPTAWAVRSRLPKFCGSCRLSRTSSSWSPRWCRTVVQARYRKRLGLGDDALVVRARQWSSR